MTEALLEREEGFEIRDLSNQPFQEFTGIFLSRCSPLWIEIMTDAQEPLQITRASKVIVRVYLDIYFHI